MRSVSKFIFISVEFTHLIIKIFGLFNYFSRSSPISEIKTDWSITYQTKFLSIRLLIYSFNQSLINFRESFSLTVTQWLFGTLHDVFEHIACWINWSVIVSAVQTNESSVLSGLVATVQTETFSFRHEIKWIWRHPSIISVQMISFNYNMFESVYELFMCLLTNMWIKHEIISEALYSTLFIKHHKTESESLLVTYCGVFLLGQYNSSKVTDGDASFEGVCGSGGGGLYCSYCKKQKQN